MAKFINPFTDVGLNRIFGQNVADVASLSKAERMVYDENLRKYRDTVAVMEGQYLEGIEKGIEKGKLDVARMMKANLVPIDKICLFTGLTAEEIEAL